MHVFGPFTYAPICLKNVCQASLPSFLLLVIFCLDQYQVEIASFSAHHLLLIDKPLVYELRVMAAVEMHLNATDV